MSYKGQILWGIVREIADQYSVVEVDGIVRATHDKRGYVRYGVPVRSVFKANQQVKILAIHEIDCLVSGSIPNPYDSNLFEAFSETWRFIKDVAPQELRSTLRSTLLGT